MYRIRIKWDDEVSVWIATSKSIPGLVLESGSFDALLERVKIAISELLKLNGVETEDLCLEFSASKKDYISASRNC